MAPMKLVAAALVAAFASSAAAAEPPIQPGYWESTNSVLSPIRQTTTERRCITPADVEKFLGGPSNHHYDCVYPGNHIAGGKIVLSGVCTEKKKGQKVKVAGQGTYTPTSFHLDAEVAMTFLGIPVAGRAATDAHRIGDDCPAPDAK
jgi:hypothetical protein